MNRDDRRHSSFRDRASRTNRREDHGYAGRFSRETGGIFGFGHQRSGLNIVFFLILAVMVIALARLFLLQVVDSSNLSEEAKAMRTNVETLEAKRGTIYDRNGNVLATSIDCYDIYANPKEVNAPSAEALMLQEAFSGDAANYRDSLSEDTTFVYLVRKADKDKAEELQRELKEKGYSGIYLIKQSKRIYPYGAVAGQIIGMVDIDGNGLTGLELQYDDVLKGTDGELIMETGATGTPIAGGVTSSTEPQDGKDIHLALDIDIQKTVEDEITKGAKKYDAAGGLCMITNPKTGEILAAASTPLADISQPDTITNEGLNFKLVTSSYEPGSIMKIFTIATGIEDGLFDTDQEYDVPGSITVGSDTVRDDDGRWETMAMSPREILRRSSNVGAALLAQDVIGAEKFSSGLAAFQFGTRTNIDYPGEISGTVRSLDQYEPSSLGSMAFGQGMAVPMVQVVKGVGAIANGGWLETPHFVVSVGQDPVEWHDQGQAISQETAEKMTDMLEDVFTSGTAYSGQVEGYELAGKTGTGEQADENGYIAGKYLSSLVGFGPTSDPQVLCYVGFYETPYLAYASAAPVFSSIMGEALHDLDIKPSS
ncbi:MAG: peptidoglycan D,D-transpeptidase FtsI family protein [Atopobiaceae bacterium]